MIKAQDLTNEWLTKEDVEEIIKLNTYGISAVFDILLGKKGSIQELEEGVSTNIKHLKELLRSYN
ncbi:MAG: hypothetical protein FJY21_11045 [Bacteroidetes bacterium]|nr:hypothetical protein [Bacteroidota bacterium]